MIELSARAKDPRKPYENLLPIVIALTADGNRPSDGGFVLNPDGWRCRMTFSLAFDVITATFQIPTNIVLPRETDTVLDKLTWCSIEGPGLEWSATDVHHSDTS